jgi:hypothetical protein
VNVAIVGDGTKVCPAVGVDVWEEDSILLWPFRLHKEFVVLECPVSVVDGHFSTPLRSYANHVIKAIP